MSKHYDFAGWATKNDIRCSDGRTIRHGAFSGDNGKRVPLVWMHNHKDVNQVLGHADLEERPEGMYAYCSFNGTDAGQNAKECVEHGDVVALSIYANELKQSGCDVLHGAIKEVSVVLAGANRGAIIDNVLAHGEISDEAAEIQFVGYGDIILHSDEEEEEEDDDKEGEQDEKDGKDTDESKEPENKDDDKNEDDDNVKHSDDSDGETIGDIMNTLNDKQKKAVAILIDQISSGKKSKEDLSHADDQNADEGKTEDGETVGDVIDTLTDKQKKVVEYLDGEAAKSKEGGSEMKHNAFEGSATEQTKNTLSHDDFKEILKVGQQMGSLSAAFEQAAEEGFIEHADQDYGVVNLDFLFPEAKTINTTPEFIKREMDWVDKVIGQTHSTPFSRVKSIFANITEDEARARGYIKGKYKKEEVFSLLKRTTDPTTVYKKQKLDKQDIDDITDMNVVSWIKTEMQMMLKEEVARAILIGDGRLSSSDDKINEQNIRPIYNDADLYCVKIPVVVPANATDDQVAEALIKAMVKSRKQYKGSGNPSMFTTDDYITDALLLENGIGERKYKSEAEVATAMRVKELVPVEVMENQMIEIDENGVKKSYPLIGVEVNMKDYNTGTNGGAKTDFFDDFDLDFNQYKYLYETRMSGALIKPFSAISFYLKREGN